MTERSDLSPEFPPFPNLEDAAAREGISIPEAFKKARSISPTMFDPFCLLAEGISAEEIAEHMGKRSRPKSGASLPVGVRLLKIYGAEIVEVSPESRDEEPPEEPLPPAS